LITGHQHVADLVTAVQKSRIWKDCVIIITYDENGGRWDHVSPPVTGIWGDGSRVPAIIIGPLAKRGFVDHTQYDTLSILKTIERRFNLAPLSAPRRHRINDLTQALDWNHTEKVEGPQAVIC
jgi:phospholipase C